VALRLNAAAGTSATGSAAFETFTAGALSIPLTVTLWGTLAVDRNALSFPLVIADTGGNYTVCLSTESNGTVLKIWDGSFNTGSTASRTLTAGTSWFRAAVVVNSTTSSTFYHGDGTPSSALTSGSQTTSAGAVWDNTPNVLALGQYATGWGWNGRVAAVKVWSAALTASEIAAEFQRYRPVRRSGLIRWYPALFREVAEIGTFNVYAPDNSGNSDGVGLSDSSPYVPPTFEDGPPIPW
jgi:hypothetical protein